MIPNSMPLKSPRDLWRIAFSRRISFKLALAISLLAVSFLLVNGAILTWVTRDFLKTSVRKSHEEIAARAASEVAFFVNRPVELLSTAAKLVGRSGLKPWDQETVLVEMSLQFPMYEEILSLSLSGERVASSNPNNSSWNYPQESGFRKALKGFVSVSEIRIDGHYLPYVQLWVPYRRLGKVAGVLAARVNLQGMWDLVDGIRIGTTGRAFVAAQNGLMVAHPDKKLIFQNKSVSAEPYFSQMSSGRIASGEYAKKNGLSLISFAPVKGPIPLFLVIERQAGEAYGLLARMQLSIQLVLIISLIISIAASILLAQWLVRPIKSLQGWSRRIALGDFDYRIRAKTLDELGRLFIMFKRMSARLKVAREKERLAALGETASTISHKLKNAIVSLKTFAQLFPQRKNNLFFIQRFERNFTSTVEHLEKIFNSLSQIASTRRSHFEAVFLDELLFSLKENYLETFHRRDIKFVLELDPALLPVFADREQLRELFVNLIQNAFQAMPKGGVLTIQAKCESGSLLKILVSDTGPGIAPQHLGRIFKPFFTTKNSGMGLGLAICQKIAADHGGKITVATTGADGTAFCVSLPAAARRFNVENPENFTSPATIATTPY